MSSATASTEVIVHRPLDGDAHPAQNHLQDARAAVRTRVAYIREWGRWVRDWANYLEESHMTLINQRLDAILGINR